MKQPDSMQSLTLWQDAMAGHLVKGQEEVGNRLGLQVGALPRHTLTGEGGHFDKQAHIGWWETRLTCAATAAGLGQATSAAQAGRTQLHGETSVAPDREAHAPWGENMGPAATALNDQDCFLESALLYCNSVV